MSRGSATSTRNSTTGSWISWQRDRCRDLLDIPNDELMLAGNGTGEVRAWVAVAGAMQGHKATTLAYEPIYEWINGMGVVLYDGDRATTKA